MLPANQRLKTTYEFNLVRRKGFKKNFPFFSLFVLDHNNYDGPTKFGVVISTKLSKKATKRNRLRRLYIECIRKNLKEIKPGFWVVIHPNIKSFDKSYEEICADFDKAIQEVSLTS